jgi:hypothetical protein
MHYWDLLAVFRYYCYPPLLLLLLLGFLTIPH